MHALRYNEGRLVMLMGESIPLVKAFISRNDPVDSPSKTALNRVKEMVGEISESASDLRGKLFRHEKMSILSTIPEMKFKLPLSSCIKPERQFQKGAAKSKYLSTSDKSVAVAGIYNGGKVSADKGEFYEYTISNIIQSGKKVKDQHLHTLLNRCRSWIESSRNHEQGVGRLRMLISLTVRVFDNVILPPPPRMMKTPNLLMQLFFEVPTIDGIKLAFERIVSQKTRRVSWVRLLDPEVTKAMLTAHHRVIKKAASRGRNQFPPSELAIILRSAVGLLHFAGKKKIPLVSSHLTSFLAMAKAVPSDMVDKDLITTVMNIIAFFEVQGVKINENQVGRATAVIYAYKPDTATAFLENYQQRGVTVTSGWAVIVGLCLRDGTPTTRPMRKYKELGGNMVLLSRKIVLTMLRTSQSLIKADVIIPIIKKLPKLPPEKLIEVKNPTEKTFLMEELIIHSQFGDPHYCQSVAKSLLKYFVGDSYHVQYPLMKSLARTNSYDEITTIFREQSNTGGVKNQLLFMSLLFIQKLNRDAKAYFADLWEDVLKHDFDVIVKGDKGTDIICIISDSLRKLDKVAELNDLTNAVKKRKGLTRALIKAREQVKISPTKVFQATPKDLTELDSQIPSKLLVSQMLRQQKSLVLKTLSSLISEANDEGWSFAEEPVREAVEALRLQGRDSHGKQLWSLFTTHKDLPSDMFEALSASKL